MQYLKAEKIYELNKDLSAQVSEKFKTSIKVRFFENSQMALYDLCVGLQQFLTHKPKIGMIRKGSSLFEGLLPHYYRLQCPIIFKKDEENILQYSAQLDHEVNYVLWTAENEITGEVFLNESEIEEIHKTISTKRIFSIQIKSYLQPNDFVLLAQNPYAIIVVTGNLFSNSKTLVLHSEKLKTPFMIGHFQTILHTPVDIDFNSFLYDPITQIQDTTFKDQYYKSHLNYLNQFSLSVKTLEDRYVIISKSVTGAALKQQLGLSDHIAIAPSELPLSILESFQNWWPEAKNQNDIRGMLILRRTNELNSVFWNKLIKTHEDLTTESTWTI